MGDGDQSSTTIRFRNYIPKSPELRKFCLPQPSVALLEEQLDNDIQKAITAAQEQDALLTIAPKRPNWDLKRDISKNIAILNGRTTKAIIKLIRKKIEEADAEGKVESNEINENNITGPDEIGVSLAKVVAEAKMEEDDEEMDNETN
eukprot:GHVL01025072.1.p1 GENE.GHVL01025072.1~~GHVL01025072.1.p1  ORF type:complete len:147 (+),score=47.95 GHVL01025072.1:57-497(+)